MINITIGNQQSTSVTRFAYTWMQHTLDRDAQRQYPEAHKRGRDLFLNLYRPVPVLHTHGFGTWNPIRSDLTIDMGSINNRLDQFAEWDLTEVAFHFGTVPPVAARATDKNTRVELFPAPEYYDLWTEVQRRSVENARARNLNVLWGSYYNEFKGVPWIGTRYATTHMAALWDVFAPVVQTQQGVPLAAPYLVSEGNDAAATLNKSASLWTRYPASGRTKTTLEAFITDISTGPIPALGAIDWKLNTERDESSYSISDKFFLARDMPGKLLSNLRTFAGYIGKNWIVTEDYIFQYESEDVSAAQQAAIIAVQQAEQLRHGVLWLCRWAPENQPGRIRPHHSLWSQPERGSAKFPTYDVYHGLGHKFPPGTAIYESSQSSSIYSLVGDTWTMLVNQTDARQDYTLETLTGALAPLEVAFVRTPGSHSGGGTPPPPPVDDTPQRLLSGNIGFNATFEAPVDARLDVVVSSLPNTGGQVVVALREVGSKNRVEIRIRPEGKLQLYVVKNGAENWKGATSSGAIDDGDTLSVEMRADDEFELFVNGAQVLSPKTIPDFRGEKTGRFATVDAGAALRDLDATDLAPAPPVQGSIVYGTRFQHPLDARVAFDVNALPTSQQYVMRARQQSAHDCLELRGQNDGRLQLYLVVDGVAGQLGATASNAVTGGSEVALEMRPNNEVEVYVNDASVLGPYDVPEHRGYLRGSFPAVDTGASLSNLQITDLSPDTRPSDAIDAGTRFEHDDDFRLTFDVDSLALATGPGNIILWLREAEESRLELTFRPDGNLQLHARMGEERVHLTESGPGDVYAGAYVEIEFDSADRVAVYVDNEEILSYDDAPYRGQNGGNFAAIDAGAILSSLWFDDSITRATRIWSTLTTVPVGLPIQFGSTLSDGVGNEIGWSLGGGFTSTEMRPVLTYPTPGTYNVRMSASIAGNVLTSETTIEVVTPVANPTAIYVDPATGDDNNAGGLSTPVATITRASALATPGATIYLRGGTYQLASQAVIGCQGTEDALITVRPYPGEAVIVSGANLPQGGAYASIQFDEARYVVLRDITVADSPGRGISLYESEHIWILGCTIDGTGMRALGGSGSHLLFVDNDITNAVLDNQNQGIGGGGDWTAVSGWPGAVDFEARASGITPSTKLVVWRNRISDSWGEGIVGWGEDIEILENEISDAFSTSILMDGARRFSIRQNFATCADSAYWRNYNANGDGSVAVRHGADGIGMTKRPTGLEAGVNGIRDGSIKANIIGPGARYGMYYYSHDNVADPSSTVRYLTVRGNTIDTPVTSGMWFDSVPATADVPLHIWIQNNIIPAGSGYSAFVAGMTMAPFRFSPNCWPNGEPNAVGDDGAVVADPQYANPESGVAEGYRLQSTSPCIGAGDVFGGRDFGGSKRLRPPAIGAWEYLGPPPPIDTTPPTLQLLLPLEGEQSYALRMVIEALAQDDATAPSELIVQYRFDGGFWEPMYWISDNTYRASPTMGNLAVGSHTVEVRAQDRANNRSQIAVRNFERLAAPPIDTPEHRVIEVEAKANIGEQRIKRVQHARARLDYVIDWSPILGTNDTISQHVISHSTNMKVEVIDQGATRLQFWASGVAGGSHFVTDEIHTNFGRVELVTIVFTTKD